jgi:hypothetical protein
MNFTPTPTAAEPTVPPAKHTLSPGVIAVIVILCVLVFFLFMTMLFEK